MLFDLRGRGRRRTVQITYIGLAVIFMLGFVGLGVGGGFGSSGIFSAFTGNEGSGGVSHSSEIKKYQQLTKRQPSNANAWEKLIIAQQHEAGGEAYVTRGGGVTSKGKELYAQIAQSWSSYLALNPAKTNPTLAKEMVTVFSPEGINDPVGAVQALQIVVAADPSSLYYTSQLAANAYRAHNTRVGDLASEKAVRLAPEKNQRLRLKNELAALKKNPTGTETTSSPVTATAPTTVPSPAGSSGKKK
jgi:hypothetical protein